MELQERRQKFLVDKVDPYEIDFEAWHSNLAGLCDFMRLLIDELGLRSCVILSGDVHYGLNVQATFGHDGQLMSIAPVFLTPTLAEGIVAEQPPRLEETRSYVRPDGHRNPVVVGDNKVGLVSVRLRDGVVVHQLLVRRAGRTMPHTASLPLWSAARLPPRSSGHTAGSRS